MRKLFVLFLGIVLLGACHSEGDISGEGKAKFSLNLSADPSFAKTKAVNTSVYEDVNNYMVELSKEGNILETVKYGEMELIKELEPGSYSIRAYCGENVTAGYDQLYVEGSQSFNLVKGDNREVKFTCVPANVKVNIKFEDNFFEFYSDCKVNLKTAHLSSPFVMTKDDAGKDAFFKADRGGEALTITFDLKDKQGVDVTPENFGAQTVTIKPRDFLTITIKPKLIDIDGGKIDGITVTIDDSVTSQDIPIEIPDEFLPGDDTEVGN